MVNSLSACGNTGNEYGVVILFGGGGGHPTTIYHNRNYLQLLPSVAVGSQKVKKLLEHSTSARGVARAPVELHDMWSCMSARGVGKRRSRAFKQKKKFIKIGPLLRKLQAKPVCT